MLSGFVYPQRPKDEFAKAPQIQLDAADNTGENNTMTTEPTGLFQGLAPMLANRTVILTVSADGTGQVTLIRFEAEKINDAYYLRDTAVAIERIKAYYERAAQRNHPILITGLAHFLGVNRNIIGYHYKLGGEISDALAPLYASKLSTFTGKPCATCGGTERYTNNRRCRACTLKQNRRKSKPKTQFAKPKVDPAVVLAGVNYQDAYDGSHPEARGGRKT